MLYTADARDVPRARNATAATSDRTSDMTDVDPGPAAPTLFFSVGGEVGVEVDGERRTISAASQRATLAILALAANRVVSAATLIESIWGDRTPQRPEAALQIVISRLRASLGPAASRLVSSAAGYRLEVAPAELDVTLAHAEFERGRALLRDGAPERACDALGAALALCCDEPLRGLAEFPFHGAASDRLRELRLAIFEARNDALLAAGRQLEVLASIEDEMRREPWRERLHAQHMLALYQSGRQVDALREYDAFRSRLVEELGVEPGEELRALHRRLLDQDPPAEMSRIGVVSELPPWTSLSLPFVGRGAEEERIFTCVRDVVAGGRKLVLVEGESGIGKTRLVLEVARRARESVIVVSATANDARTPAMAAIANALLNASLQLGDDELRLCLGKWPGDLAEIAPALRQRLPDLEPPLVADDATRAERLRSSLVSWISALSRRAPILLLLDDVHRAGPGLLMLLGNLFVAPERPRVLVLATTRSAAAERSSRLAQLVEKLEAGGSVERIMLEGLDLASVSRMLSLLGRHDLQRTAAELHDATGGQPFFLGELIEAHARGARELTDVSVDVQEFVRRRVRALGSGLEQLLQTAAGFHAGFDIPLLAEVAETRRPATAALVDRAADAGILRPVGVRMFTFVHELTRRALIDSLQPAQVGALHRRIAMALEERDAPPGLLASHWRLASGAVAKLRTAKYARAAGFEAMRLLEPVAAARWFVLAHENVDDSPLRGRLLLLAAEAQHHAGDPACVASLRAAIDVARQHGDAELLVECALTWAPVWSSLPPLEPDERVRLLEDACAAATDDVTRARLLARLATELLYTPAQHRCPQLADRALVHVGEDSARARAEVLMRHFHATTAPHTLAQRRAEAAEALDLVADDDVMNRCFALTVAASGAVEAAELACADAALDEMLALADRHELPTLTFNATVARAWREGLAGNLDRAARLARDAGELGAARGIHNAAAGMSLQLACITWQRENFGDLLQVVRHLHEATNQSVASRIMLGRALVDGADRGPAREALALLSDDDIAALSRDIFWSTVLVSAAEAALMLGLPRLGAIVHRELSPFADQVAFVGNWVVAPIAYGAALGAAASANDDADQLFAHALGISERLRAPVLRARTEVAWVVADLARGSRSGERKHWRELLDDARAVCASSGLDRLSRATKQLTERIDGERS